jgi:hypothetical protein
MGLADRLKKEALSFSQKAIERLMSDEQRAMKIANAIGSVQKGKAAIDRGQDTVMRQLNFATKGEFKEIGKRLSALKRRARELDEKLDSL